MKRRLKRKLHNSFLWVTTYSAFILFFFSLASISADSAIPAVVLTISLAWMLLFSLANEDRW